MYTKNVQQNVHKKCRKADNQKVSSESVERGQVKLSVENEAI